MKNKILYFSDCTFFAGCENMIANFLNSNELSQSFDVSFAYNYSIEYENGLNSRLIKNNFKKHPLNLFKQISYNSLKRNNIITNFLLGIFLLIYKYFSIIANTVVLYKFFRKNQPDILHINNGGYPAAFSCYSAVIAAHFARIPKIIYVVNNLVENYSKPFRWLDFFIDSVIVKWVHVFITGSQYAGDRLINILHLSKTKHLNINNGISNREISLDRNLFLEQINVNKNKFIITTIANLEKRKGHIVLLNAILLLKNEEVNFSNFQFILEGFGPEKPALTTFVNTNKLENDVIFFDRINNVFNLINASDLIILPSISNEDFPNIILEAMSLGKPVIGTKIAGIPEQIDDGVTGLLVNPLDVVELKNSILELINNDEKRNKIGANAKTKFLHLYTKDISVKKYINLYNSITKI